MNRIATLCTLSLLGSISSASSTTIEHQIAGTFTGTWRLVSWTERLADGTSRVNPQTVAYLIYTDTGRMCYVGMNPNRSRWKSAMSPTPQEAVAGSYRDFGAYCGMVEIHATDGFVIHHVEIDQNPGMVGKDRKRWFRFQGAGRLSLRVDTPELRAPIVESVLLWQRIER